MRIALYLRVSTDVQDFNRQKTDLTAKALNDGHEIAFTFSDKISGFKNEKNRPDLNKLLQLTKENIQAVYISELSRLSRNPTHLKVLIDQFTEKGINVYSLTQNINTLNKEGKTEFTTALLISILSEYSSYEISLKNERVKSGKKECIVVKGNSYTYKPPFGYKNENKKLVINEQEAETITDIFNKYATGTSIKELVQYLNLNKIPTRNTDFMKKTEFQVNKSITINKSDIKWGKSSIRNILRNTVYCGYKVIKGGETVSTPVIVKEKLFKQCQDEIKDRIANTDRSKVNDFMLRGFFICGVCGNHFLGSRSHDNLLYKCSDKTHVKSNSYTGCRNTSIFKDHVEPMIWDAVKGVYITLRTQQIKEGNISTVNNKIEEYTIQIEAIENEQIILKKESDRLITLFVKGIYDEDLLDKKQKNINSDSDSLTRTMKKLMALKADSLNKLEAIKAIDNKPFDLVEIEKSYELQKEAVKELVKEVIIYKVTNKYTVFEVNLKAGYKFYIIREVWTKKYFVIDGNIYSFNPKLMVFSYSGMNPTKGFSYEPVTMTDNPIDLFNQLNIQNSFENSKEYEILVVELDKSI